MALPLSGSRALQTLLLCALALLVSDLVKLSRHEDDPKERIPWIVFTAWAARTGFPSWRGGDAVALGRALRRIFGSMYESWLEERAQIRIRVKP